jgi:phage regulator Rha-like protein
LATQFWGANFKASTYKNRGKKYPEYLITRDGWTFLVMGFTGKKAARFKEAYINQFNRMEELIKSRYFAKIEYKPMMEAIKDSRASQGKRTNHFHYSNEELVGLGLWNIGKELKYIRDNKTYKQLGLSSFQEYTEKELDYSRRKAYNFIRVAEKYDVHSGAQIGNMGIKKLLELAKIEDEDDIEKYRKVKIIIKDILYCAPYKEI